MKHAIIAAAVCTVVVAVASLTFGVRMVQSFVIAGPSQADVNEDNRVNSIDLMLVAKNFLKPVPTATLTPTATATLVDGCYASGGMVLTACTATPTPTHTPTATATPNPRTWEDFMAARAAVEVAIDAQSYHRIADVDEADKCSSCSYSYRIFCDWGDAIRSWSSGQVEAWFDEVDPLTGATRHGMQLLTGGGSIQPPPADLYCFDEYPFHSAAWCFTAQVNERRPLVWKTYCRGS